jgi:hypothetical protein
MPSGILRAPLDLDPHRSFKTPAKVPPAARVSLNEPPPSLLRANGPLNPDLHPYNPASQVQQANTYAKLRQR